MNMNIEARDTSRDPQDPLRLLFELTEEFYKKTRQGKIVIETSQNGILNLHKFSLDRGDFHEDSTFGQVKDRIIFARERIMDAEGVMFLSWDNWLKEGPLQCIRYSILPKHKLSIGFTDFEGGGIWGEYSLEDGTFLEEFNSWTGPERPNPKVRKEGDLIHINVIHSDKEEKIILPSQIDLKKWIPIFFDKQDKTITDFSLPWQSWFRELGAEYYQFSELKK